MDLRQTILQALNLCILPTSNLYQLLTRKIKIFMNLIIIKERNYNKTMKCIIPYIDNLIYKLLHMANINKIAHFSIYNELINEEFNQFLLEYDKN